jgi:type IV secretion system protein VirB6
MDSLDFSIFSSDIKDVASAIITLAILIISGLVFLGVCASTLIVLKLSTTIFLVIGPVFIAFFLFDATKHYAWGWINLIAGFMLTNVLFGIVVSIEINYINSNLIGSDGMIKWQWANLFAMPIIFGAFTALAQAIPDYAASVMGGSPAGNAGGLGTMLNYGGLGAARKMAGAVGKFTPRRATIK